MRENGCRFARIAVAALVLLQAPTVRAQAPGNMSANGLHYTLQGSGPVIVLIHAFQMDLREWDAVAGELAKTHRVLRYDVRGHGSSRVVTPLPSTIADLAGLLDELQVQRATLVGSSMGATVGLDFALTHPDRVERLVLIAPGPPGIPAGPMPDWMGPIFTAVKAGKAEEAAKRWWESPMFDRVRKNAGVSGLAQKVVAENAGVWTIKERPPALIPASGTQIGALAMPVLVVAGEQDELGGATIGRTIAGGLRKGRLVLVPDAGHMLTLERPREVVTLIAERP
jgi:3-oxoadipate enol-lactonase